MEVLRERADARAILVAYGDIGVAEAADELWFWAEARGLIIAIGADEVQHILATAFDEGRNT